MCAKCFGKYGRRCGSFFQTFYDAKLVAIKDDGLRCWRTRYLMMLGNKITVREAVAHSKPAAVSEIMKSISDDETTDRRVSLKQSLVV